MALKHVGRFVKNKRKVVVAYRTVPGEPDQCVVVTTENLMADEHDALMKAVESDAGQNSYEFAEAMIRNTLPDGRNMLAGFHVTGRMMKIATNEIEMLPDQSTVIRLDQLNEMIAEQRGVSIEDLAIKGPNADATKNDVVAEEPVLAEPVVNEPAPLSDDELAAQLRSQADAMFKEAKRLREQAEELAPIKKKAATKTKESA